jgi:hypothetical protein
MRDVLHPSVQVGQYKTYLQDSHAAFHPGSDLTLNACSNLHNYGYAPRRCDLFREVEGRVFERSSPTRLQDRIRLPSPSTR